jgi:predicted ATPase
MNTPAMRALSQELLASTQRETDTELVLQAHHATWSSSWPQGLLCEAHRHAEAGLRIYEPDRHHAATSFFGGHDAGVCCRQVLGLTGLLMGYPDQAVKAVEEAVDLARRLKHPFTLAIVLAFASFVHQLRKEALRVRELTQTGMDVCTEQSIPAYLAVGRILNAWAMRTLDGSLDVEPEVRNGLEILSRLGSHVRRPYYLGLYAENCLCHARLTEGLAAVDEAMALAETGGERWYQAELYRVRGVLLLHQDRANQAMAEANFGQAMATARGQQARWLELRAATSLARLWADQAKRKKAHDLLAPVYGWFTEGFDTADLKDAKALLDSLG